ncbi:hypothetical protein Tco_0670579 [Tanacetum coccineum]
MSLCSKRHWYGGEKKKYTLLWLDCWKGDASFFRDAFPRIFALEQDKQITVANKLAANVSDSFRRRVRSGIEQQQLSDLVTYLESVSLFDSHDRWVCSISGDGSFSVKDIRNSLDDLFLPSWPEPTRWIYGSQKYLEGQSMQRPPLFESDGFIYWKNRFETYVKSKDLDLWHVITDDDFPPIQNNPETNKDEIVTFHKQNDDLKKKLAKNNEAKMVIYNALPRNNQVKANKIDLLVQQYEQFMISEEESTDNVFTKFNTIITSLKAFDEGFSSKNYVRKFLGALHPKWRAKVTAIEESKNLRKLEGEG